MSTTILRRRGRTIAALSVAVALGVVGLGVDLTSAEAATVDTSASYELVSRASGKALDVEEAATGDGARVQQWTRNGNTNQQWQFVASGNGYYRLRARHSGKVVDVLKKVGTDGATVGQWTDNNGDNQQWSVQDVSDGYVVMVNRRSGKALDVAGSSTADGADVLQWPRHNNPNQQWQLVKAGAGPTNPPPASPPPPGPKPGTPGNFSVPGNLGTHDPSRVVYDNGLYAFYSTGGNIPVWLSNDGRTWRRGPDVFRGIPEAVRRLVPVNNGVWAPDVIWNPNTRLWNLYYSVANWDDASRSAIGLVTSPTLNPSAAGYKWTDRGVVIATQPGNGAAYNSIDPAPFFDSSGKMWMVFGSGYAVHRQKALNVIALDKNTGLRGSGPVTTVQTCGCEASYVQYHSGYYYLFWNTGGCCSGASSSYLIHVARSRTPAGPYTERSAKFLASSGRVHGPGHIGITSGGGTDYFTYHYYPDSGGSVLGKGTIRWGSDGWPSAA